MRILKNRRRPFETEKKYARKILRQESKRRMKGRRFRIWSHILRRGGGAKVKKMGLRVPGEPTTRNKKRIRHKGSLDR